MKNYQNISYRNHLLKFSILLGLTLIMVELIMQITQNEFNYTLSFAFYLFLTGGLVISHISFKKHVSKPFTYKTGFSFSSSLLAISLGLHSIFFYLYIHLIDNGFVSRLMDATQKNYEARGFSPDEIQAALGYMAAFQGPLFLAFMTFAYNFIIGLLISSLILISTHNENVNTEMA